MILKGDYMKNGLPFFFQRVDKELYQMDLI